MNETKINKIYDILIELVKAPGDQSMKAEFHSFMNSPKSHELRFQGTLGFGGKF